MGKEQEDPVAPRAAGLSLQLLPPAPALPSALVGSWRFDVKSLAVPPLGAHDLQPEKWLKSHFSQCSCGFYAGRNKAWSSTCEGKGSFRCISPCTLGLVTKVTIGK